MSSWRPFDVGTLGIARCSFKASANHQISLTVGDFIIAIEAYGEPSQWYRGWVWNHSDGWCFGIFPCSHVHVLSSKPSSSPAFNDRSIAHQDKCARLEDFLNLQWKAPKITQFLRVMRPWNIASMKCLKEQRFDDFRKIVKSFEMIVEHYGHLSSGIATEYEQKALKSLIHKEISDVQQKLGLDLINFEEIPAEVTSISQIFTHYQYDFNLLPASQSNDFSSNASSNGIDGKPLQLLLTIKACIASIGAPDETASFYFSLYDRELGKFISQEYVATFNYYGMMEGQSDGALFTHLDERCLHEHVWLICRIVRNGRLLLPESTFNLKKNETKVFMMRRPFGIALLNLNEALKSAREKEDSIMRICIPTDENEFPTLHEAVIEQFEGFETSTRAEGICVHVNLFEGSLDRILVGNSFLLKNVHLVERSEGVKIFRPRFKANIRNTIFIDLMNGEFNQGLNKKSAKNIQVECRVKLSNDDVISRTFPLAGINSPMDSFESLVIYHRNNPYWIERIAANIPSELFTDSHLFFTFKHCSNKDKVDKNADMYTFAFAYIPLCTKGRVFEDGRYQLVLYKHDKKIKAFEYLNHPWYLHHSSADMPSMSRKSFSLPLDRIAFFSDLESSTHKNQTAVLDEHFQKLSFSKDYVNVYLRLSSNKFTQDIILSRLLGIGTTGSVVAILDCLKNLGSVGLSEIFKFFQDILGIIIHVISRIDDLSIDVLSVVPLKALVHILSSSHNSNPEALRSDISLFLRDRFKACDVYSYLLIASGKLLAGIMMDGSFDKCPSLLECWEYLTEIMISSFETESGSYKSRQTKFLTGWMNLQSSLIALMKIQTISKPMQDIQNLILNAIPKSLGSFQVILTPDVLVVFCGEILSCIHGQNYDSVKKLSMKNEFNISLIKAGLFDCHDIVDPLIAGIVDRIKKRMTEFFSDIDNLSHRRLTASICNKKYGLSELSDEFCHYIQTVYTLFINVWSITLNKNLTATIRHYLSLTSSFMKAFTYFIEVSSSALARKKSTSILSIFSPQHSDAFAMSAKRLAICTMTIFQYAPNDFETVFKFVDWERMTEPNADIERVSFIMEVLSFFSNTISFSIFPSSQIVLWLRIFSTVFKTCLSIHRYLSGAFESVRSYRTPIMWTRLFKTLATLLKSVQSYLDAEISSFSPATVVELKKYRDETLNVLKSLWIQLSKFSWSFFGDLFYSVIELTTMTNSPFFSFSVDLLYQVLEKEFMVSNDHDKVEEKALEAFDNLFSSNQVQPDYNQLVIVKVHELFEKKHPGNPAISSLFNSLHTFIELLCDLKSLPASEAYEEERCSLTFNLMQFIVKIKCTSIYIKYIYQLLNYHLSKKNYEEAGFTICLHADLYSWETSDRLEPLPPYFQKYQPSFERKEVLFLEMIDYFDKGKNWENAIQLCKELAIQYETKLFDYQKLANILRTQARLFEKIVVEERYYNEFFRVGYYGLGFPSSMRNQQFIYRGNEWEKIATFCERIQNKHPHAKISCTNSPPTADVMNSSGQFIQIAKVDIERDYYPAEKRSSLISQKRSSISAAKSNVSFFVDDHVHENIRNHYNNMDLKFFSLTRPLIKSSQRAPLENSMVNEFLNLWAEKIYLETEQAFPTVLRACKIVSCSKIEISPIENAINAILLKTKELQTLTAKYQTAKGSCSPLTMSLSGAIDAPVNGGITLYRKAFLDPWYVAAYPEAMHQVEKLRSAIVTQVQTIQTSMDMHDKIITTDMRPLHENLMVLFKKNFSQELSLI